MLILLKRCQECFSMLDTRTGEEKRLGIPRNIPLYWRDVKVLPDQKDYVDVDGAYWFNADVNDGWAAIWGRSPRYRDRAVSRYDIYTVAIGKTEKGTGIRTIASGMVVGNDMCDSDSLLEAIPYVVDNRLEIHCTLSSFVQTEHGGNNEYRAKWIWKNGKWDKKPWELFKAKGSL